MEIKILNELLPIQESTFSQAVKIDMKQYKDFSNEKPINQPQFLSQKITMTENFPQNSQQTINQNLLHLKNLQKDHFIYFKFKQPFPLAKKSQGIIFFKQNYEHIYRCKHLKETPMNISEILIRFYADQPNTKRNIKVNPMTIHIESEKISLFRYNQANVVSNFKQEPLIPKNPLDTWSVLEKKIWIQINEKINQISINSGDIQNNEKSVTQKLKEPLVSALQRTQFDWKHCQKTYKQIEQETSDTTPDKISNPLLHLSDFEVYMKFSICQRKQKQFKNIKILSPLQYIKIKSMKVEQKRGPQLKQNPSILQPQLSIIDCMSDQIKYLFSRLKNTRLASISGFEYVKDEVDLNKIQQKIGFAIHNSLITKHTYIQKSNKTQVPIGILNHVLQMKTDHQFKDLMQKNYLKKSAAQLYQQIITQRIGYIRFTTLKPKGCYPGSPVIVQIWPPFYCSPIHNHGQAYGISKVLMGQVRVQNFQDLNFQKTNHPYLKKDYQKGQYTWFSQNSYGLHRVMNMHNVTCLTLQGYYDHIQGFDQYFSFIEQKPLKAKQNQKGNFLQDPKHYGNKNTSKQLCVYYPQHDWQNYLHMKSIESEQDRKFIKSVIDYYKLQDQQSLEIDCSFQKFTKVMLSQYDFIKDFIDIACNQQ